MIAKNLYVSFQYRKRYPFVYENRFEQIDRTANKDIKRNLIAGGINKLTDVAINQTDSIIISSIVGVNTLGVASNYLILRGYMERFTKPLIDNMGPIVGNFVSIESTDKKQNLVKILQFVSFWIYGFCSICFFCLGTPFIKLWLGDEFVIPKFALLILSINFMLSGIGDRPYNLFKNSHGIFYDDWYLVLASAVINLLASVIFTFRFGLSGVFLGMTVSIVFSIFIRPIVFYTKSTGEPLIKYYSRIIGYLFVTIFTGIVCYYLVDLIFSAGISIRSFVVTGMMLFFIINVAWALFFHCKTEFKYVHSAIKKILNNVRKRR
jgi:O-antigen/teichoic acid export membrane protein